MKEKNIVYHFVIMENQTMVYAQWTNDLSVNHERMDKHHKRLLLIINQLFYHIQNKQDLDKIPETLLHLKEYTEKHLSIEEELLKSVNYPDLFPHLQAHDEMRNKIKDFNSKEVSQGLSRELITFLKDWWLNHIKLMDLKYKKYF